MNSNINKYLDIDYKLYDFLGLIFRTVIYGKSQNYLIRLVSLLFDRNTDFYLENTLNTTGLFF